MNIYIDLKKKKKVHTPVKKINYRAWFPSDSDAVANPFACFSR